jgi:hypothetical protein
VQWLTDFWGTSADGSLGRRRHEDLSPANDSECPTRNGPIIAAPRDDDCGSPIVHDDGRRNGPLRDAVITEFFCPSLRRPRLQNQPARFRSRLTVVSLFPSVGPLR